MTIMVHVRESQRMKVNDASPLNKVRIRMRSAAMLHF